MPLERHVVGPSAPRRAHSSADRVIAARADAGDGVVSRAELLAAGVTPDAIRGRIERGLLIPLYRGVYAVGHRALTQHGRWRAALLAVGEGAVLSHRSAGHAWSVAGEGSTIDVSVPANRRGGAGIRLHRALLPPDEVTELDGLPVTTIGRTLIDLAAVLRPHQLERALRDVETRRLGDALALDSLLTRHRGRRGLAALRVALHTDLAAVTRSELEDRFLRFCRSRRLPPPASNATLLGFEVDLLWREARVVGELDGYATHAGRMAFEADRDRDRRLVAAGWRVVRITWRQLHHEPAALAADLRAILGVERHVVGR
jgi:very-short-patch-repair endonuclease